MTQDELLQIIEKAAAEETTELDLSGNDLTELPPEIGQLVKVEKLILGKWDDQQGYIGNQLTALPPEIVQLTNLPSIEII